jgi:hypothetical protein
VACRSAGCVPARRTEETAGTADVTDRINSKGVLMGLILWLSLGLSLALAVGAGVLILLAYAGSASVAAGVPDRQPAAPSPGGRFRGWNDAGASHFAPSGFAGH